MYNVLLKVSRLGDLKIYDPIFNLFPRDQHIMEELKISIKEDGLREPIVVDADNYIIDGMTRYLVLKELAKESDEYSKVLTLQYTDLKITKDPQTAKLLALVLNVIRRPMKLEELVNYIEEIYKIRESTNQTARIDNDIDKKIEETLQNITKKKIPIDDIKYMVLWVKSHYPHIYNYTKKKGIVFNKKEIEKLLSLTKNFANDFTDEDLDLIFSNIRKVITDYYAELKNAKDAREFMSKLSELLEREKARKTEKLSAKIEKKRSEDHKDDHKENDNKKEERRIEKDSKADQQQHISKEELCKYIDLASFRKFIDKIEEKVKKNEEVEIDRDLFYSIKTILENELSDGTAFKYFKVV